MSLRVLIYHSPLNFRGGAERVLELILKRFDERGIDYRVITSTNIDSHEYINRVYRMGRIANVYNPKHLSYVVDFMYKFKPDMVFITQPGRLKYLVPLSLYMSRFFKIIRMPDEWFGVNLVRKSIYRLLLWRLQRVKPVLIAICEEMKDFLYRFWRERGFSDIRIDYVIPPPYDEDFYYYKSDLREEYSVLIVSRINPDKRVHVGLKAFRYLVEEVRDARLYIVGYVQNKKYYSPLQNYVSRHSLRDKVFFITKVSRDVIREYYWRSRVLWNFSTGFGGIVNVEAMACGVIPVVTPNSWSIVRGYGRRALNAREYADNTVDLLSNTRLLDRISYEASLYALKNMSSRVFIDKVLYIAKTYASSS